MPDAERGRLPATGDERVGGLPGLQPGAEGLLDLLVGAAEVGAVPGQDRELVGDGAAAVGDVEQVAGVGIPGDQPQGLALAGASDQDRWPGTLGGRRRGE